MIRGGYSSSNNDLEEGMCSDGVTIAYLNDDYCDCPDGMDEPKTSACSEITVQRARFKCLDGRGSIFSSRRMDGIVDCADGSDEATGFIMRLP